MSPTAGSARVVFSGSLAGGEIWSTGFWLTGVGTPSQGVANALALLMWGTCFSSDSSGGMRIALGILLASPSTCDRVNTYIYPGGSNLAEYIGEYVPATPFYGEQPVTQPNQVGCVVSLRTELPGRRHRGRMYLPATSAVLDTTGQFKSANVDTISAGFGLMFSDISSSDAGTVVVMSSTASVATPVNQVIVDSRADIQRRRANREIIEYSKATPVTA